MRAPSVAWLGLLGAAACGSAPDIELRDRGLLLPSLRVRLPAVDAPRQGPGGNCSLLDLAYAEGSARGGAGYALFAVQGLVQVGTDPDQPMSARLLGGLEYADLRAHVPSVADDRVDALGPLLGAEVHWRPVAGAAAFVRGTASALLPDATSLRWDAGAVAWPAAGLELFVGYRWWHFRRDGLDELSLGSEADVDLRLDGFLVGLGVAF